jgi:dTDP-4-dehydrorhamnose reductase
MRILVTGTTGQVGSALLAPLSTIGSVIPAGRAALDLSAGASVAPTLERLRPDLIINPAAYTAVDRAEDEPDLAYAINADAPARIAQWAAARGVPLIHLSTDYVFDGGGQRPWGEEDAPRPLSVYGASKLAGEERIRAANGPHLVVRTSWVYAAQGRNFLRTVARLAAERTELRIVADQIGAPTPAPLIADAIARILRTCSADLVGAFAASEGLVHLAATGETSWHGFATAIVAGLRARGAGLRAETITPISSADYPTKAQRPLNSRLRLTRLQRVFGIVPPTWDAALVPELDAAERALASSAS